MRAIALLLALVAFATTGTTQERPPSEGPSFKTITKGLDNPVGLVTVPTEASKIFVVERQGLVRILENGKLAKHALLDIEDILSPEENPGLSSLAFPNDYATSGAFYVSYTDKQGDTILGRFLTKRSESANEDDLVVVLKIVQPSPHQHSSFITFGPDGYLYVALGDTPKNKGSAPLSQNTQSLFGKVLRIDVSNPQRYTNPNDNPFAQGRNGAPEVWAYGFQHPRHLSFDAVTKRLFLIDSGREVQEIDLVERGKNFGWSLAEGERCLLPECDTSALANPVYSYKGSAVGGFVYTGNLHSNLKGSYIFADIPSKSILKLTLSGGEWKSSVVATASMPIVALAQGIAGETYVAFQDGTISALIP